MTIIAKKVSRDGTVENVSLNDEPTDPDLIKVLGGDPNEDDYVTIGWVYSWEVLRCTNSDYFLIIGKPLCDGGISRRKSCDLDDVKAKNVIKLFC